MSEQHTSPVPMIRLHDGAEIPRWDLACFASMTRA